MNPLSTIVTTRSTRKHPRPVSGAREWTKEKPKVGGMMRETVEEKIADELLTVAAQAAYHLVYGPAEPWNLTKLNVLKQAIGSGYRKEAIQVVERELVMQRNVVPDKAEPSLDTE